MRGGDCKASRYPLFALTAPLRASGLSGVRRYSTASQICYIPFVKWNVTFYNMEVEAALLELPASLLAKFIRYAERMETYGPDLGMPHTRAMGKGLFELRIKSAEGIGRVFYCTRIGRNIVFLHHFVKKTPKTPRKELDIARRRLKEVKSDQ